MIKSRRMRLARHVGRIGVERNGYRILMGKSEGERQLGRRTRRWEHNMKIDLGEIGWGGIGWLDMAQDADQWRDLANMILNLRVP
jgi:hypothetical protein